MTSKECAAFITKLEPGTYWVDDLPEPLETVADVEELFRMVEEKKAKLKAEAIRKAALN